MGDSLVSVVVPTRNNERTIEACLRSVRDQRYEPIELVVVDNSSSDRTLAIAQELADVVLSAGPERSAQRNVGASTATGEWLLWLDSDMVLPRDALATAMGVATSERVTVALPERTIGEGFWTACRALERSCYLDDPLLHNPRLLRRDFLVQLGGFNVGMSGPEDLDLRLRIASDGRSIVLAPVLIDHDEGRLRLREVMSKRYYYGRSLPAFAAANRGAVRRQGAVVLRAYLRHYRAMLCDPAHAGGLVAMRGLEAAAYAAGALRGRVDRAAGARQ